jgi:hypothetical protein
MAFRFQSAECSLRLTDYFDDDEDVSYYLRPFNHVLGHVAGIHHSGRRRRIDKTGHCDDDSRILANEWILRVVILVHGIIIT